LADRNSAILLYSTFTNIVITSLLTFLSLRVCLRLSLRHSLRHAERLFMKMKGLRSLFFRAKWGISGFASASPPIAPLLAMTVFYRKVSLYEH
jgi:hypothetical protein